MRTVLVSNFSKFPGPRFRKLGKHSGEEFRETVLLPEIEKGTQELVIDLDGVFGFGSSFLEEAFGGLVRAGVNKEDLDNIVRNMKSDNEPDLKTEIKEYIDAQLAQRCA